MTDFSPLRERLQWLEDVKKKLPKDIPVLQVQPQVLIGCSVFWVLAVGYYCLLSPLSFPDYFLVLLVALIMFVHEERNMKTSVNDPHLILCVMPLFVLSAFLHYLLCELNSSFSFYRLMPTMLFPAGKLHLNLSTLPGPSEEKSPNFCQSS